jgi:leader peptidase (prepilin peptidase)/N-methyltransferase
MIRRLPEGRPVVFARSACDQCCQPLGARDLVPVASYLALRGRCRLCRARIAPFHLVVELAAVAVALWAVLEAGDDAERAWMGCALGWTLLTAAWIDAEHFRLPDTLTMSLLLLGLAVAWLADGLPLALDHAIAAAAGYLLFRAVAATYCLLRGREGLGEGDAKLLAAAGAWVGLAALPLVVLAGALLGIALALLHWLRGRAPSGLDRIPFGPPLASATWLVWVYGM